MSAYARQPGSIPTAQHAAPAAAPMRPATRRHVPDRDRPGEVHPTAVIHPSALIDPSARIGAYCVIGANVRIGAGARLDPHVVVHSNTTMGEDNRVCSFAVIGHDPQDLKYRGEETTLVIGDRNTIREHATLHRGTGVGGAVTRIGSDNLLMVGAHVAHDCIIEDHCILANGVMLGGHVVVHSGATLAGAAAVHHFATIGRLAFVGGLARISKDVPPFLVVEGHPAEPRKVNSVALTRRGWDPKDIDALRAAFKALFRSRAARRAARAESSDHLSPDDSAAFPAIADTPARDADAAPRDAAAPDAPRDSHAANARAVIERLRAENACAPVLELCDFIEHMAAGVHGRWRETLRDRAAHQQRA